MTTEIVFGYILLLVLICTFAYLIRIKTVCKIPVVAEVIRMDLWLQDKIPLTNVPRISLLHRYRLTVEFWYEGEHIQTRLTNWLGVFAWQNVESIRFITIYVNPRNPFQCRYDKHTVWQPVSKEEFLKCKEEQMKVSATNEGLVDE